MKKKVIVLKTITEGYMNPFFFKTYIVAKFHHKNLNLQPAELSIFYCVEVWEILIRKYDESSRLIHYSANFHVGVCLNTKILEHERKMIAKTK